MFLQKSILKICKKLTGEHPCQRTSSKATSFYKNTYKGLLLNYWHKLISITIIDYLIIDYHNKCLPKKIALISVSLKIKERQVGIKNVPIPSSFTIEHL